MKTKNRDLLVLLKDDFRTEQAIENELERLNELLLRTETIINFCVANEILDFNRYKIYQEYNKIIKVLSQDKLKPFQFICNKN
jgi:hypothetical protein